MTSTSGSTGTKIYKQSQKFESKIRGFLEAVGFSDVSGGPTFRLGNSSQIDACGGAGTVLLVIDAHTVVEQRRTSVRNKIKALRGERLLRLRGMQRHARYRKYRDIRLVVAAHGFQITKADRDFARLHPRVYLWDDQLLQYYSKLARLIRRYAKNDLLGELDVEALSTVPKAALAVPALRTSLRGRTAYLFYAKPEALLAISYVARREKGNEQHYQRLIDGSRLGLIGAFLNDRRKKGFFANNVILNFQSKPKFKQLPHGAKVRGLRMGLLRLPRESRAAWIIDGQHRLYGFTRAGKQARDLQVPVIGFQQLSQTKQAELFLEINRHQKAVPPNLIWDLEGEINPNSNFGVISNAVKLLNQVQPFRGMISIPAEARGNQSHLKMGNICDGILDRGLAEPQTENMKASGKNPLYARPGSLRRDRLAKGLRTYFSLCASVLRSDWSKKRRGFFCTNNGLNVLLRVFEASLAYYTHRPSRTELRRILGAVQRWLREGYNAADRLEELRRATSSEGGRADVASKLLRYIEDQLKLSGFAGPRPPSTGLADQAVLLERQLARFIALEMEAHWGADWLRTRTPADVVKRVQERRGRSRKPLDQFITLGECLPIVIREDNWTQIFSKTFGKTFRGKDGFKVKFEDIVSIRNAAAHRPADLSQRDHQLFELYVETFKACMRRRRRRRSVTAATPASGGSDSGQTQQEAA